MADTNIAPATIKHLEREIAAIYREFHARRGIKRGEAYVPIPREEGRLKELWKQADDYYHAQER